MTDAEQPETRTTSSDAVGAPGSDAVVPAGSDAVAPDPVAPTGQDAAASSANGSRRARAGRDPGSADTVRGVAASAAALGGESALAAGPAPGVVVSASADAGRERTATIAEATATVSDEETGSEWPTPGSEVRDARWAPAAPLTLPRSASLALTLAVVALILSLLVGWALPVGVVGAILSILALRRPWESRGIAVWALCLSLLSVVYSAGWLWWAATQMGLFAWS